MHLARKIGLEAWIGKITHALNVKKK
jgi:hypothetical protein